MRFKLIKPLIASCLLPLAFSANAEEKMMSKKDDFNFVTIKAGLDQPVVNNNNAGVNSVNTTFLGGIEVGRSFMDMFAVSAEYNYVGKSKFNISDDQNGKGFSSTTWGVRSDLFLVNLSANLAKNTDITPYVKLGLGAARNKVDNYVVTNSDPINTTHNYSGQTKTNFAWRIGLGATMAFNEKMDLDVSYAFTDRGKAQTKANYYSTPDNNTINSDARSVKLKDHAIMIGVKVKF